MPGRMSTLHRCNVIKEYIVRHVYIATSKYCLKPFRMHPEVASSPFVYGSFLSLLLPELLESACGVAVLK